MSKREDCKRFEKKYYCDTIFEDKLTGELYDPFHYLDDEEFRLMQNLLVEAVECGDSFSIIEKYVKIVKKLEKYFKENSINQ